MEWTQGTTLAFIEAYKRREIIWKINHPLHFHKVKRLNAWRAIAHEVNKPVDECRKKMEELMASFRRENLKVRKSITTGNRDDESYESSWFAYESMKFILDRNKPRKRVAPIQNGDCRANLELMDDLDVEEQVPRIRPQPAPRNIAPRIRGRPECQQLDPTFPIQPCCLPPGVINDDSQHFGNLVISKLRKFDEMTQCAIQNAIMGIFLDASRGFYNVSYPQPNFDPPGMHHNLNNHHDLNNHHNLPFSAVPPMWNPGFGPQRDSSPEIVFSDPSTTTTPYQSPTTSVTTQTNITGEGLM